MNRKSYTVKNTDGVKRHKIFRGIRSYISSLRSADINKPRVITNQRASRIVEKLSRSGKNVALLSFHKSIHNAVVILTPDKKYSYVSAYANSICFLDRVDKNSVIDEIADDEQNLMAELRGADVVYIGGLNTIKMVYDIRGRELINKFNYLSNNCARFAADVLLAGCNIKPAKFKHNRPTWQMPANTIELAKEIDLFLRKKSL